MTFSPIYCVLFDMDGVITDTMAIHCYAWKKAFEDFYAILVDDREIYRREGEKSHVSVKSILGRMGVHLDESKIENLIQEKANNFIHHFAQQAKEPFYPGVLDFLHQLSLKVKIGLVTGSQRSEVNKLFSSRELSLFSTVVTTDDVSEGKPHPEPYLRAAKTLKLQPSNILVVENAPLGVESAKGAGASVLGLGTTLCAEDLGEVDFFVKDHGQLFDFFNKGPLSFAVA